MSTRQSKLTEAALTERALRLLATRERSRFELRRKLLRRHASHAAAATAQLDIVLDDLVRRDLLSDARFAEAFVRRGVARGHGPLKIRAGLRSCGVAEDIIDDTLTFSDDFWLCRAQAVQTKRFGKGSAGASDSKSNADGGPANRSEWARRARFLAARGFASDTIYRTLTRAP